MRSVGRHEADVGQTLRADKLGSGSSGVYVAPYELKGHPPPTPYQVLFLGMGPSTALASASMGSLAVLGANNG